MRRAGSRSSSFARSSPAARSSTPSTSPSSARVERLTAGLLAALVTGGFLYAASGLSIFVVRQIQSGSAFKHALYVPGVYLAAALAGAGGATLGRVHQRTNRQAPIILAAFVAVSGLLDVASAITPAIGSRLQLIEDVT